MADEISRARYEHNKLLITSGETALDRALPKILGPIFGGKGNYKPPDIPEYDEMVKQKLFDETYSPSGIRYDSADESDQFVSYQWWKKKDASIIEKQRGASEVEIGGNEALNHQHYQKLANHGLSDEDAGGLDQS